MNGPNLASELSILVPIDHPAIEVALAYATTQNFTGEKLYAHNRALLIPEAAAALDTAAEWLLSRGLRLVVLDAFRPADAQRRLWQLRPDPEFVADPDLGSDHTRGIAVDVTLSDGKTHLDMGTAFDAAVPQSHHDCNDISREALANRELLRAAMKAGGFIENPHEWWHYALRDCHNFPLLDCDIDPK